MRLPKDLRTYPSAAKRRDAVATAVHADLTHVGHFSMDESVAGSRNCENLIGVCQIPLGVAGPVAGRIHFGGRALGEGEWYLPMATTEGALVASVSRGAKAIVRSGGANVAVDRPGTSRGPVFLTESVAKAALFEDRIKALVPELKRLAGTTSSHIRLIDVSATSTPPYTFVRFSFDTGDAMGMNMATIAAQTLASYLHEETGTELLTVAGNYDSDKKPAWANRISGRGFRVMADVFVPGATLKDVLHVHADRFLSVWQAKCLAGSLASGAMGNNAHIANTVAAMYIATGQDPAHVVGASMGTTLATARGDGISLAITVPELLVGTVGGGTGLATQKEALSILGVSGGSDGSNAAKLAGIFGMAILAGELSLLASLTEGSLVRAHRKLGRGEDV